MDEEGAAKREGRWMRKEQQEVKVGEWGRRSRKGRLMEEEGIEGREDGWMRKEH